MSWRSFGVFPITSMLRSVCINYETCILKSEDFSNKRPIYYANCKAALFNDTESLVLSVKNIQTVLRSSLKRRKQSWKIERLAAFQQLSVLALFPADNACMIFFFQIE